MLYGCDEFGPLCTGQPQQDSSIRDTAPPRQDTDIPTPKGTDHTPPIMVPDMGDISAGHSPAANPTVIEAAILEGTPHAPLPATAAALPAPEQMYTPITIHAMTPTGIVTPHPTLATSPTYITHATPQTTASLAPATPTKQHRNLRQEKPKNAQDPQHPETQMFKDCHHTGFPSGFIIRFRK